MVPRLEAGRWGRPRLSMDVGEEPCFSRARLDRRARRDLPARELPVRTRLVAYALGSGAIPVGWFLEGGTAMWTGPPLSLVAQSPVCPRPSSPRSSGSCATSSATAGSCATPRHEGNGGVSSLAAASRRGRGWPVPARAPERGRRANWPRRWESRTSLGSTSAPRRPTSASSSTAIPSSPRCSTPSAFRVRSPTGLARWLIARRHSTSRQAAQAFASGPAATSCAPRCPRRHSMPRRSV